MIEDYRIYVRNAIDDIYEKFKEDFLKEYIDTLNGLHGSRVFNELDPYGEENWEDENDLSEIDIIEKIASDVDDYIDQNKEVKNYLKEKYKTYR